LSNVIKYYTVEYSTVYATLTAFLILSPYAILSTYDFTAFIVGSVNSLPGKVIPPKLLSLLILSTV
jgi:hypothetical protein